MAREQQLLKGEDGFYVGRALKNGNMSADAYRISNAEIVAMFEDYLIRHCVAKQTTRLEICRGERTSFVATLNVAV